MVFKHDCDERGKKKKKKATLAKSETIILCLLPRHEEAAKMLQLLPLKLDLITERRHIHHPKHAIIVHVTPICFFFIII